MAASCPVELDFSDSTPLNHYEASSLVEYLNTWPRFGFPKEFPASLFLKDKGNNDDGYLPLPYLTGIFMWSCIFSSLLIIYILILLAYNSHPTFSKRRHAGEILHQIDHSSESKSGQRERSQLAHKQKQMDQEKAHWSKTLRDRTNSADEGLSAYHQHGHHPQNPMTLRIGRNDIESHEDIPYNTHRPEEFRCQNSEGNLDLHDEVDGGNVQVYNQLDSEHILRHLQATEISSLATLPQSQFISPSVSRKRLLEAYFDSIMNTSTMLKLGWFSENEEGNRPQPNQRNLRVAKGHTPNDEAFKARQRWTFEQVFAPPRQEDDDGSAFQPPVQTRTFSIDSGSESFACESQNIASRVQEGMEVDENISPKTAATASSGSNSSGRQLGTAFTFKGVRSKRQGGSMVRSSIQEHEPDSCFQILTLFAGFMLLLFVILLCSDGLLPLGLQSDSIMEDWHKVMFSSLETKKIIQDVQQVQSLIYDRSVLLHRTLDRSCPAVRPSLCTQVGDSYSCNVRGIPLHEFWDIFLDIGIQPTNITTRAQETYNWTLANQDLHTLSALPLERSLNVWKWILRAAGICNAILLGLILLVLWSVAVPNLQCAIQNDFVRKSRAFVWLFWIATFCVWVVAIASLAGTFVLSDFCVQSPADHTVDLLFGNEATASGQSFLSQEFWKYHIDGCPAEEYPDSFQTEIEKWSDMLGPAKNLQDALEILPAAQFELVCGADRSQLQDLQLATSHLEAELCTIVQTLASLRRSLKCANWYPHFESIVYESVCEHGTFGVGWTALAEWIIVVMSLTVWTFDVWRSPLIRREPTLRIQPAPKKRRLQDDKLGKFPVVQSRSTEESLVERRTTPALPDAHLSDWTARPVYTSDLAAFAQIPQVPVHPMEEKRRLPLDPPASDGTASEVTDSVTSEMWEESQPHSFFPEPPTPEIERVATRGLGFHSMEHHDDYESMNTQGNMRHDMNNTLPVPRFMARNSSNELAASSLFQLEDDSSDEEDLVSL